MIQRTHSKRFFYDSTHTRQARPIINQRAEPTLISINNHTDTNEFGEIGEECQGRERTDKNCYLSLFIDLASCSFSSLTHQLHHHREGKEMFSFDCTLTWVVVVFIQLLRR
jgi:hypothetical protein